MKSKGYILILLLVMLLPLKSMAQYYYASNTEGDTKTRSKVYLMPNVYPAVLIDGDTVACMQLFDFIKYSPVRFRSQKEVVQYNKLIRDVKKTLPYAKEISNIIIETYEYMETLPNDKARQKHWKRWRNTYTMLTNQR
jgi:hypothetical protein